MIILSNYDFLNAKMIKRPRIVITVVKGNRKWEIFLHLEILIPGDLFPDHFHTEDTLRRCVGQVYFRKKSRI